MITKIQNGLLSKRSSNGSISLLKNLQKVWIESKPNLQWGKCRFYINNR